MKKPHSLLSTIREKDIASIGEKASPSLHEGGIAAIADEEICPDNAFDETISMHLAMLAVGDELARFSATDEDEQTNDENERSHMIVTFASGEV